MYAGGNVLLHTGLENRRPHTGREVPTSTTASTTSWLEQYPRNYVILLSLSLMHNKAQADSCFSNLVSTLTVARLYPVVHSRQ